MKQRFSIFHWRQISPPHVDAINNKDGEWEIELDIEGLVNLSLEHDVMIIRRDERVLPLLLIDQKGYRFRQR